MDARKRNRMDELELHHHTEKLTAIAFISQRLVEVGYFRTGFVLMNARGSKVPSEDAERLSRILFKAADDGTIPRPVLILAIESLLCVVLPSDTLKAEINLVIGLSMRTKITTEKWRVSNERTMRTSSPAEN